MCVHPPLLPNSGALSFFPAGPSSIFDVYAILKRYLFCLAFVTLFCSFSLYFPSLSVTYFVGNGFFWRCRVSTCFIIIIYNFHSIFYYLAGVEKRARPGVFCPVANSRFQQPLFQKTGRRYKLRVPGSGCGWESDGPLEIGVRGVVADLFSKMVFRGVVVGRRLFVVQVVRCAGCSVVLVLILRVATGRRTQ